jgi:hypothetical protein
MKKNEIRTLIATDGERVDWLANLPTSITDLNRLQKGIKSEFKESAVERCRQQLKQSAANTENGRALKKPTVTRAILETYRQEFVYREGREWGWITSAAHQYGITENTIRARLKENK